MGIDNIVSVQISVSSRTPSLANFGQLLLLAFHTVGAGGPLVRTYGNLEEATQDGHSTSGVVYAALKSIFSQSPRVPTVKVGRRGTANRQSVKLTPTDTTTGKVYTVSLTRAGVRQTVSYTVLPAATPTIIATGLKTAIDLLAIPNLLATVGAGFLTLLSDADGLWTQYDTVSEWLTVEDTTAVVGLVADLAAVTLEDPGFYGLLLDNGSKAAALAIAAVVETQQRLLLVDTSDTECTNPASTTDVLYLLEALAYGRTFAQYDANVGQFLAAALAAQRFTANPGSDTWAFKTLAGVFPSVLNTTKVGAVEGKHGNIYTTIADINVTQYGWTPGGQFVDVVRGIDWLTATIQQRVFALFLNNEKVPYTDPGIALIMNEISAQLKIASVPPYNLITPAYTVTGPKVANVTGADKIARILRNVRFTGQLQGAVHSVVIVGVLTP